MSDANESRHLEALLDEQHELAGKVIGATDCIILVLDSEGLVEFFNPFMEKLSGYPIEEARGADWFDTFLPPADREEVREVFGRTVEGTDTSGTVGRILTRDGRTRRIVWSNRVLRDPAGELAAVLAVGQDITDLEAAQSALQDAEALMAAVVENAVDGIITIDTRGIVQTFNRGAEKIFGFARQEVIGRHVRVLMPDNHAEQHDDHIERYLETGEARIIGVGREVQGRRKDGSEFPMHLSVSEIVDDAGRTTFAGVVRDLTERRELERHLARAASEERRHVAHELHDSVSGQLTGIAIQASLLEQALGDSPEARRAEALVRNVESAQDQLRKILRGLLPVEADELGLMAALRQLARDTESMTGVSCDFVCDPPVPVRDSSVATHLYRIVQEAVQNALRHAEADSIVITLSDGGGLSLAVRDDGVGIEWEEPSTGMGLRTMRYRADLLGGDLEVVARGDRGTVVRCTLPPSPGT